MSQENQESQQSPELSREQLLLLVFTLKEQVERLEQRVAMLEHGTPLSADRPLRDPVPISLDRFKKLKKMSQFDDTMSPVVDRITLNTLAEFFNDWLNSIRGFDTSKKSLFLNDILVELNSRYEGTVNFKNRLPDTVDLIIPHLFHTLSTGFRGMDKFPSEYVIGELARYLPEEKLHELLVILETYPPENK